MRSWLLHNLAVSRRSVALTKRKSGRPAWLQDVKDPDEGDKVAIKARLSSLTGIGNNELFGACMAGQSVSATDQRPITEGMTELMAV